MQEEKQGDMKTIRISRDMLGALIKKARVKKGMPPEELAKVAGVTVGTVGTWERGYSLPTQEKRLLLASILGQPNDWLDEYSQVPASQIVDGLHVVDEHNHTTIIKVDRNEIGALIKMARISRCMSAQELAEAVGVKRSTVYAWESGRAVPDWPKRRWLSSFFGKPVDWLDEVRSGPIPTEDPEQGSDAVKVLRYNPRSDFRIQPEKYERAELIKQIVGQIVDKPREELIAILIMIQAIGLGKSTPKTTNPLHEDSAQKEA